VEDLRRRVLVTLWQTSADDPRLDRLIGATSFGVLNVACNRTVRNPTSSYSYFFGEMAEWLASPDWDREAKRSWI